MRHLMCFSLAAILAGVLAAGSWADVSKLLPPEKDEGCGQFGTAVQFVKSPSDAARKALKEEKLVFVLHVSGNFETPDFT